VQHAAHGAADGDADAAPVVAAKCPAVAATDKRAHGAALAATDAPTHAATDDRADITTHATALKTTDDSANFPAECSPDHSTDGVSVGAAQLATQRTAHDGAHVDAVAATQQPAVL